MKKIKVSIINETELKLEEDALKGDIIDLNSVQKINIDCTFIKELIANSKDKIYADKIKEIEKHLSANNENKLKIKQKEFEKIQIELENKNELLKLENVKLIADQEVALKNKYEKQIIELNEKIAIYDASKLNEFNQIKQQFEIEKNELSNKLNNLNLHHENEKKIQEQEITEIYSKKIAELEKKLELHSIQKEKDLIELESTYKNKLYEKENEISELNRVRSVRNIKLIGEDLEQWCDTEVQKYMQNGFLNCTWKKDNNVIRQEGETKGSKADFIFTIYKDDSYEDANFLTNICLEMKSENPSSINKKKNEDYYKQLDKNRAKKNCKYALLVSELELDNDNILPFFKVREYADMYVVRPSYLMDFLNILVSLTMKFQSLLVEVEQEEAKLKASIELVDEFEKLRNTYLNKPLEKLRKEVEAIKTQTVSIRKSIESIDKVCNDIIDGYISEIHNKLDKFNIKKLSRQLEKLSKVGV